MKRQSALAFVRANANPIEQARLHYLLTQERPTPVVVQQVFIDQREDGGWSSFWAADDSSLDATCFRFAQAEQLGISAHERAIRSALAFLEHRQRDDGSWEEEEHLAGQTPPWLTPGDLAARLYLTANCGFWLATFATPGVGVDRAAGYLRQHLDGEGQFLTFPQTLWLAGGLWYRLHWPEAHQVFRFLQQQVPQLSASNLAWLMSTLLLAGLPLHHPLIEQAAARLEQSQEEDGRWSSEDGAARDVHATLEAMRVLRLCGRF